MEGSQRISAVGIPWYRRDDYERIRAVMVDGHRLPPTFAAWLKAAQQVIEQLHRQGAVAVKAHVDPDAFVSWCAARGLQVDADARQQFAAAVARGEYREGRA